MLNSRFCYYFCDYLKLIFAAILAALNHKVNALAHLPKTNHPWPLLIRPGMIKFYTSNRPNFPQPLNVLR